MLVQVRNVPPFPRSLPLPPRGAFWVVVLLSLCFVTCGKPTRELPFSEGVHGLRWGTTVEEALGRFPDLTPDPGGWYRGALTYRAPTEVFGDSGQIWLHFNSALGLQSGGLRVYPSNVDSVIVAANRVFGRRALDQGFRRTGELDDHRIRYDGPGVHITVQRPIRDINDYVNVAVVTDR